jgi:hypothetical protein
MKISTRVATMVGATVIAASALATVSGAAGAATYTSSSALRCHYNVVHVPALYLLVFKQAYRYSAVIGSLSSAAKRVPGACTKTHETNGYPRWFIKVKASNGRIGYAGATSLQKVK